MQTRLGLLTSKKTAVLYSASTDDAEVEKYLDRYSQLDLFEMLLITEYLLLKEMRKHPPNQLWRSRLARHEALISTRLLGINRTEWMVHLGFKTAFDGHAHAKDLLFSWFR